MFYSVTGINKEEDGIVLEVESRKDVWADVAGNEGEFVLVTNVNRNELYLSREILDGLEAVIGGPWDRATGRQKRNG